MEKMLLNSDRAVYCLRIQYRETGGGQRRDSFIEEAGNLGKKGGFMSQETNSFLSIREQNVLKEHFRGLQAGVLCANSRVSSDTHLGTGHVVV